MRLALYQPEIPQNVGTLLRLSACLNIAVDLIEPCGFILSDKRLRRSGMDYLKGVDLTRHNSFEAFYQDFLTKKKTGFKGRLLFLTPEAPLSYTNFSFQTDDIIMVGRESDGAPLEVKELADYCLSIPLKSEFRSLNVAISAAMVLSEALRQTGFFKAVQGEKDD